AEFRAAGYSKVVRSDSSDSIYQRLTKASSLYESDWRVILVIRPWLLKATEQEGIAARNGNDAHAVGLDSEIVITNFGGKQLVQPFIVWTWASTSSVPKWKKPLTLDAFKETFDYIAGKY